MASDKTPATISLTERAAGTLLAAAAGDAMGWMTEFIRSPKDLERKMGLERITEFQAWNKRVGGRFHGYEDEILAGDYSDDTQLTISTAACIKSDGRFDTRTFCQKEYPLWLEYARGAGGTIKEAAKRIQRKSASWNSNFFRRKLKRKTIDYRDGGANGAAMRISPHVLANVARWEQAETDIWRNSIISHGHPRAIVGALLYGYALHEVVQGINLTNGQALVETLGQAVKRFAIPSQSGIQKWMNEWNRGWSVRFENVYAETLQEAVEQLRLVWKALHNQQEPKLVLEQLGCFHPDTKGSGLATAIAGIYLFARQLDQTQENIILATNMIGSDTDSIAAFVGGLGGAAWGRAAIPVAWRDTIQDSAFLDQLGTHLAAISTGKKSDCTIRFGQRGIRLERPLTRQTMQANQRLVHSWLGPGTITKVDRQSLLTGGKTATIIRISFDMGQSGVFAFRTNAPSQTLFASSYLLKT